MIKLFKDNFTLFKNNMVLVQPLLLFFIVSGFISMIPGEVIDPVKIMVILLCIGSLSIVFYAGWFNMLKSCVKKSLPNSLNKTEIYLESLKLFKDFFPGVALYFVPLLFISMLYLSVLFLIAVLLIHYGINSIGIPVDLSLDRLVELGNSEKELYNYIFSLSDQTKTIIVQWELLIFSFIGLISILGFLTMFWWQNVVYYEDGLFKSLLRSLKMILEAPIKTFCMSVTFSFLVSVSFFIAVIPFILTQFLGMIAYIMVFLYFNLLLFKYIDSQNNSDIGSDGIGQN